MLASIKTKFLGDKKFYHTLLILIIPMIVQQGITSFVSLLDNVMVGRLGTEPMSGVAIVNQLFFTFELTLFGGMAGASIFGAQFFGKGDHDGVRYAFRFKVIYGVLVAAVAIVILLFWHEPLIHLFLTDSAEGGDLVLTYQEAEKYLYAAIFGLIPFAFSQALATTLKESGETFSPMVASSIAIGTNLALNYILIFGNFGAPRLGVVGAAIATVIARFIELGFLVVRACRMLERFPFLQGCLRSLRIPGDVLKKIFITGFPLILNEILWSVGTTMVNQSYSTRGLTVVAAVNITVTVWRLFCIIMFAMGNAISILVGQQLGAGQLEKARQTDNRLLFFATVLHIGIGGLICACAPFVPMIYNTTDEVRALTTSLLIVAGIALPIDALAHCTYFTLRSGGKTWITFLFDCVFTWAVSLPIAFCLSRFTAVPVVWIYAAVQAANIIKVVIGILLLKSGVWANNIVADHQV